MLFNYNSQITTKLKYLLVQISTKKFKFSVFVAVYLVSDKLYALESENKHIKMASKVFWILLKIWKFYKYSQTSL